MKKRYKSKNGRHWFGFEFVQSGSEVRVFCHQRPSLNGRDSDSYKTHIFSSGQLCFVSEKEPKTQRRAEQLASQWAEYYLDYRRTGKAQS